MRMASREKGRGERREGKGEDFPCSRIATLRNLSGDRQSGDDQAIAGGTHGKGVDEKERGAGGS